MNDVDDVLFKRKNKYKWSDNISMSQIDDQQQFKLGQQLAISQLQSVSDRYSTQQDAQFPFEHFPPLPSRKLHQSTFSVNPRLSQNITNKRPQALLMESYSRGSYHHQDSSPASARERKVELQKIGDKEVFECKCCRNTQAGCPFCMDTKSIQGNSNVIKFFQYIIAFKMGVNQSYGQKRLISASSNRSVNQFCSDFFSNNRISTQSQYNARQSSTRAERGDRMSIRSKKCPKSEIAKQLNTLVTTHDNYRCDQCGSSPIVGNRYHCTQCQDYDECQHCHTINGHRHLMERVDRCGRGKQLESMVQLLAQPTGKQSLRPPPSIKKENDMSSTTTRSALR